MSTINLEDRDAYVAECCALILAQKSVQEVVVMDENGKSYGQENKEIN